MSEQLAELSCEAFTAELASTAPTPGGGGVAALLGALGVSLCAMAANLTRNKKKYEALSASLTDTAERTEALRLRFLALIDADAAAFAPLAAAYSLPKDDPAAAAARERALLDAAAAPMDTLRLCAETAPLLERLEKEASPLMRSDVGCAALCCRAALDCAAMNVWVNTRLLPDNSRARALEKELEQLRREALPRLEAVAAAVTEKLVNG